MHSNSKYFSFDEKILSCLGDSQKQSIERIAKIIKEKENKNFILFVHKNADPDSLCSAITLSCILKQFGKQTKIIAPDKINAQSKKIISTYPYPIYFEFQKTDALENDVFILLDAPHFSNLDLKIPIHQKKQKIIIDHHSNAGDNNAINLTDASATSTAILIYALIKNMNLKLTKEIAVFLLLAIVADTGFLKNAENADFIALLELTQYESIKDISCVLKKEKDKNQRLENLKSILRLNLYQFGEDIFVGYSFGGSFAASSALCLINAGCDIAFVQQTKERNNIIVSARARKHIGQIIDLAPILSKTAKKYNGQGGGHRTAACLQINLENQQDVNLKEELLLNLKIALAKKFKSIKI